MEEALKLLKEARDDLYQWDFSIGDKNTNKLIKKIDKFLQSKN